jgi:hypothetical protein
MLLAAYLFSCCGHGSIPPRDNVGIAHSGFFCGPCRYHYSEDMRVASLSFSAHESSRRHDNMSIAHSTGVEAFAIGAQLCEVAIQVD